MDSSESNLEAKLLSRDYKCPCGKTYLSNAAIFTHIKQKHGGVAPGPIEKPKLESKPRGRPPLANKTRNSGTDKAAEKSKQIPKEDLSNSSYYEAFVEIFTVLNDLQVRQEFNPEIWQSVESFRIMQNFIDAKPRPANFKYIGVCLGMGLAEFLRQMSQALEKSPWRFEQVLIIFILLLQYAIDENNRSSIMEEAPVEILVDYMNPFIREHIQDYAEYLGISQLWIVKEENMNKVFLCFYNWLKWKNYTQYCITLI